MEGEHRLIARQRLTADDLAQLDELVDVCSRQDGCDLSFVAEMATTFSSQVLPQPLYYEHGQLVGVMGCQGPDEELEAAVLVHPAYRRRGIGRSLLAAAATACVQHGIGHMLLVGAEDAPSGRGFAEAVGAEYRFSEYRMALVAPSSRPSPTPPLRLEPVRADNLQAFARVTAAAFGGSAERAQRRSAGELNHPDRRLYLAWLGETPVGAVRATRQEQATFITTFGVLPEHRRRGFGRQILLQFIARLQADDWQPIFLEVMTDNHRALSLYHSCGFRETNAYAYYHLTLERTSGDSR